MEVSFTILLDRDGVINRDSPNYIKNWDEFQFLPGALEALNLFASHGLGVIIITNQSIINRGMVPQEILEDTHCHLRQAVERTGGRIQDIFFCPHRPDEDCACRKPKPGLIIEAQKRYHLDPHRCIMIGDSAKDIEAGLRAGCGATILVRTANGGKDALAELSTRQLKPTVTADDLLDAARRIIAGQVPMAD